MLFFLEEHRGALRGGSADRFPDRGKVSGVRRQGQDYLKSGASRRAALHNNIAAVVLDNFLHNRQPHARSVLFAKADEGLEQLVTNLRRDPGTVVANLQLDTIFDLAEIQIDATSLLRDAFARVEQEVVEDAFHLAGIEPALAAAFRMKVNADSLVF